MVVSLRRRPVFNPIRFVLTDTKRGIELPGCALVTYRRHHKRAK